MQQLNRLFITDSLREMLEGKDYRSLDIVFPLLLHFWTGVLECQGDLC